MIISRRWPYVTLALVTLNFLIFLVTHGTLEDEGAQFSQLQSRIVRLAAEHPGTPAMTAAQQRLISSFRRTQAQTWENLSSSDHKPAGAWETESQSWDPDRVTQEMIALGQQLDGFEHTSLTARFSLYPLRITAISYLTASFLHRSWVHLIFNLVFLGVAGAALEEVWGWNIFLGFYVLAGAAAVWSYAIVYPNTVIPLMGASGALAAVMGAFLIRFPKTRMMRGSAIWTVRPRLLRFSSPVYLAFPVWILAEAAGGSFIGESGKLGYWAQGGAFAFGVAVALTMRFTGIDKYLEEIHETKEGWIADPHLIKAGEYVEKGRLDLAISEVKAQIDQKPASVEAHDMLVSLYLRKKDTIGYLRALEARCDLRIKIHDPEGAWQDYVDYCNSGDHKMPADAWLELCRIAEGHESWERAAREYEELAESWPREKASVVALIAAGRLNARHGRPEDAKRFYLAAQKSSVPHADWDDTIRKSLDKVDPVAKAKS